MMDQGGGGVDGDEDVEDDDVNDDEDICDGGGDKSSKCMGSLTTISLNLASIGNNNRDGQCTIG